MTPSHFQKAYRNSAKIFLSAAIVASPLAWRIPFGPAPLTLTDLGLLLAAAASAQACLREVRSGQFWRRVEASVPLVCVLAMSALLATEKSMATKEFIQIAFYVLAGAWVCSRELGGSESRRWAWWAMSGALAIGIAGCVLSVAGATGLFQAAFGNERALGCCLLLMASLWLHVSKTEGRANSGRMKMIVGTAVIMGIAALVLSPNKVPAPETEDLSRQGIPQHLLEGYAALSVLSEHPLFGVGVGTYQLHIGEYYQGMPKNNTIRPGTRIGYGVVVASTGLLGLSAFLFWVVQLWRSVVLRGAERSLRLPLVMLLLCVCFTPPFVGQILLPAILMHGLICGQQGLADD